MHLKTFNLALRRCLLRWIRCYQGNGLLSMVVHAFDVDLALPRCYQGWEKVEDAFGLAGESQVSCDLAAWRAVSAIQGLFINSQVFSRRRTISTTWQFRWITHCKSPSQTHWLILTGDLIGDQHLSTFTNVCKALAIFADTAQRSWFLQLWVATSNVFEPMIFLGFKPPID